MQYQLFEPVTPTWDFSRAKRSELGDDAWIEFAPGFLSGQQRVFDELQERAVWRKERRTMYERVVDVPRLMAPPPAGAPSTALLEEVARALSKRYGRALYSLSLAYYRDGRDSVAMHGDKMGPLIPDTVIAILSLGAPRRFLLKPAAGGRAEVFNLGQGDLLVMGGSCQKNFLHGVPKCRHASPRISCQFRELVPDVAAGQGTGAARGGRRDGLARAQHAAAAPKRRAKVI